MSTRGIVGVTGAATATVSTIFNLAGEVAGQIADTAVLERALHTTALLRFRADISAAPFLVLDANLHPDTLQVMVQLASSHKVPMWFEPVSVPKAPRIAKVLSFPCFFPFHHTFFMRHHTFIVLSSCFHRTFIMRSLSTVLAARHVHLAQRPRAACHR